MLQSPILHLLQRSVKCLWWFGKHCLNSECTCAHLSAHGCNGHKMRCGQKHCWRRGLRLLINKNLVWRQCYHISVILREHYQDSDMHTDLFPLPRSVLSYFLANPPLNHQFAIVQTHLAFKGNVRWLSNWFITSWPKLIHESRNLCLSVLWFSQWLLGSMSNLAGVILETLWNAVWIVQFFARSKCHTPTDRFWVGKNIFSCPSNKSRNFCP